MAGRIQITESGRVRRVRRARRRDEDEPLAARFPGGVLRRMLTARLRGAERLSSVQRAEIARLSAQYGNKTLQRMLVQQRIVPAEEVRQEVKAQEARIPDEWGDEQKININQTTLSVFGASSAQIQVIRDTLEMIPFVDLEEVKMIVVADRIGPAGKGLIKKGGLCYKNGAPTDHIEISKDALEKDLKSAGGQGGKVSVPLMQKVGEWNKKLTLLPPQKSKYWNLMVEAIGSQAGMDAVLFYYGKWMAALPDELRKLISGRVGVDEINWMKIMAEHL